jgi:hypothetical protein
MIFGQGFADFTDKFSALGCMPTLVKANVKNQLVNFLLLKDRVNLLFELLE